MLKSTDESERKPYRRPAQQPRVTRPIILSTDILVISLSGDATTETAPGQCIYIVS